MALSGPIEMVLSQRSQVKLVEIGLKVGIENALK
jgi:hypothetical protein